MGSVRPLKISLFHLKEREVGREEEREGKEGALCHSRHCHEDEEEEVEVGGGLEVWVVPGVSEVGRGRRRGGRE